MKLDVFGTTDVGYIRELNEDYFAISGFADSEPPGLCILADGMGGHNAGEVASRETVNFVAEQLTGCFDKDEKEIPALLTAAVESANEAIYSLSLRTAEHHGMGTTLIIACITDGTAYIANVGDSRVYLLRGTELQRITVDHSVVEELIAAGTITREEAFHHPQKNIITRAVGTEPTIKTDLYECSCAEGDLLLLCSDGLTEMLTEDEISELAALGGSAEEIASRLQNAALEAGGLDNITIIGLRFLASE